MSRKEQAPRGERVAGESLRSSMKDRHASISASAEGRHGPDRADPHPSWLRKWRSLRAGLGGDAARDRAGEAIRELQSLIAHTPAATLPGLQAQAELIAELAWNDLVAAAARQLLAGIKRLQRSA